MKNTTIALDEKTLEDGRRYAKRLGYSLNAWINKLMREAMKRSSEKSMEQLFLIADRAQGTSHGVKWAKDEIYERQDLRR